MGLQNKDIFDFQWYSNSENQEVSTILETLQYCYLGSMWNKCVFIKQIHKSSFSSKTLFSSLLQNLDITGNVILITYMAVFRESLFLPEFQYHVSFVITCYSFYSPTSGHCWASELYSYYWWDGEEAKEKTWMEK